MKRWPFWLALGIAVLMFVFPPVGRSGTYGRVVSPTYAGAWDIPDGWIIDTTRLLIQYAILFGLAYMLATTGKRT